MFTAIYVLHDTGETRPLGIYTADPEEALVAVAWQEEGEGGIWDDPEHPENDVFRTTDKPDVFCLDMGDKVYFAKGVSASWCRAAESKVPF